MSYIISTCTTADMTKEMFEKLDVRYIGFHFVVNGKSYTDDLYNEMSAKEFYGHIRNGADTSGQGYPACLPVLGYLQHRPERERRG